MNRYSIASSKVKHFKEFDTLQQISKPFCGIFSWYQRKDLIRHNKVEILKLKSKGNLEMLKALEIKNKMKDYKALWRYDVIW